MRDAERFAALGEALPGYEVRGVIGKGAFGIVCAGRHVRLERDVAIKMLAAPEFEDQEARERLSVEARLLAALDHPHVVRIYDFVDAEFCAIIMERLRGGTVADRTHLNLPEARSPARACAWMLAALYGLEHAHRHGILHRDIKPENLLFGAGELLKVADFGVATIARGPTARLTPSERALGTPHYMAPEQISREAGRVSAATDVWAAGAVLYELLTGVRPLSDAEGDTSAPDKLADVLQQRLTRDPTHLATLAPWVHDAIVRVVMRALALAPEARYASAGAFAEALEDATVHGLGKSALAATGVPLHPEGATGEAYKPTVDRDQRLLDGQSPNASHPLRAPDARPTTPLTFRRDHPAATAAVTLATVAAVVTGAVAIFQDDATDTNRANHANTTTVLPQRPAGWPRTVALGWADPVSAARGVAARGGALVSPTPAQVAIDWGRYSRPLPAPFIRDAHAHGLLPYLQFYLLRSLARSSREVDGDIVSIRRALTNRRLMRRYWDTVSTYLRSVGSTRQPAAIGVEQSVWALLEQQLGFASENPQSVPALVGGSGAPEVEGIQDDLLGFVEAWRRLRNRYAPLASLGYEFADYGANVNIAKDVPPRAALLAAARASAQFYLLLSPSTFDFAAYDVAYSEHGQDPNSPIRWGAIERGALVAFLKEWVRVANRPIVLENVPLGNSVSRSVSDRPYHWSDGWVQWLVGDARFSGLRRLRAVGVVGVNFGVATGRDETCPCDAARDGITNTKPRGLRATSADDDGGYLASRVLALRSAGGLGVR